MQIMSGKNFIQAEKILVRRTVQTISSTELHLSEQDLLKFEAEEYKTNRNGPENFYCCTNRFLGNALHGIRVKIEQFCSCTNKEEEQQSTKLLDFGLIPCRALLKIC